MDARSPRPTDRSRALVPLLAVLLLFAITEVPYAAGRAAAPPGSRFDGVIAYPEDMHAYFSFVRQAAQGRWLFENPFAPESHAPVYFNLEWLLVGKAMRWLGDPGVFVAWRAVGVVLLVAGFWALTGNLEKRADRLLAMALFGLGGGFGWLMQAARALGVVGAPASLEQAEWLDADQTWGIQPFVQMLVNPHFSVAHGLVLVSLGLLVVAERTSRTAAYAGAGSAGLLACACRPYDLIAYFAAVPLLHLLSGDVFDLRRAAKRALTLVVLLPAAIPVLVIRNHPIFKPWATQGVMPVVPLAAYAVMLGVPAVVLAARVFADRRLRLRDPTARVMWVWVAEVLVLSQANRFTRSLPYSPQILVTCMGPIVMLAVPAVTGSLWPAGGSPRRGWVAVLVLALSLPSSAIVIVRKIREARSDPVYFVSDGERAAWEWLAHRVQPCDVVLAAARSSERLPRHVSAHVVAGHWAVSPDYVRREAEARAFFQGRLPPRAAAEYLRHYGVDWIWVGPEERALGAFDRDGFAPGCEPCYEQLGVRLYRCGG